MEIFIFGLMFVVGFSLYLFFGRNSASSAPPIQNSPDFRFDFDFDLKIPLPVIGVEEDLDRRLMLMQQNKKTLGEIQAITEFQDTNLWLKSEDELIKLNDEEDEEDEDDDDWDEDDDDWDDYDEDDEDDEDDGGKAQYCWAR